MLGSIFTLPTTLPYLVAFTCEVMVFWLGQSCIVFLFVWTSLMFLTNVYFSDDQQKNRSCPGIAAIILKVSRTVQMAAGLPMNVIIWHILPEGRCQPGRRFSPGLTPRYLDRRNMESLIFPSVTFPFYPEFVLHRQVIQLLPSIFLYAEGSDDGMPAPPFYGRDAQTVFPFIALATTIAWVSGFYDEHGSCLTELAVCGSGHDEFI